MDGEDNKRVDALGAAAGGTAAISAGEYKTTPNSVSWVIPSDTTDPPPSYNEVELADMNTRNVDEPKVLCLVQDETTTSTPKYGITLPQSTSICVLYEEIAKQASYEDGSFLLVWRKKTEWGEEVMETLGENSTASLFEMQMPTRPGKALMYLREKPSGPPKRLASVALDDNNVAKKNAINKASSSTGDSQTSGTGTGSSNTTWWSSSSWSYYSHDQYGDADYRGLVNQAMTCYLNSLLQSLFMSPEFRNGLYRCEFQEDKDKAVKNIPYQLQRLFLKLQTSKKRAIETTDVTKSFGWDSSEAWQQHDVQELCRVMFDAIEHRLKGTERADLIKRLYEGKMKDYVKCLKCQNESYRHDTFLDVPLSVKPFGATQALESVEQALRKFVEPETLEGDNQYFCDKCKEKCDAHKGLKFTHFPKLLTLQLKRFDLDYTTFQRVKLNDKMTFPKILNLNSFVDPVEVPPRVIPDEDLGTPVDGDPPFDKTAAVVCSKSVEETSVDKDRETSVEHHVDGDGDGDSVRVGVGDGVSVGDGDGNVDVDGDGDEDIHRGNVTPKEDRSSEEERLPGVSSCPESANSKEDKNEVVSTSSEKGEDVPTLESCGDVPKGGETTEVPTLVDPIQEEDRGNSSSLVSSGLPNIIVSSSWDTSNNIDEEKEPTSSASNMDKRSESEEKDIAEARKSGPYVYELFSVMVHSGSALGGHYYAYIKSFKNHQWYCFNDHTVSKTQVSEVERAFGGTLSSRGYYSNAYSSSANAYMLMYRQVGNDNENFLEVEEFPEYLKKVSREEEQLEEEEKRKEQRKKETSTLKLFYTHPQSGALLYEKIDVHKDDTLGGATDMGYKLLELERFGIFREQCRMVRYDDYYDLIEKSWDGMEDDPIFKVFGGAKKYYTFELFMERREVGEEFPHYDEAEIVVKYHVVDLTQPSSHDAILPTRDVRMLPTLTVMDLKEKIAKVMDLRPELLRILWEKYHNETVAVDDDEITLRAAGMHKKTKIFVEGSNEADFATPFEESRFKATVEEYLHLIHVDVYMPEEVPAEKSTQADYSYKSESEKLIEGPPLFVIKIDKRKTLGDLKRILAEKVNMDPLYFKIFRIYGNSQEFELYRLDDSLRSNPENTKIIIRRGRALQTDEYRVKIFLLDVNQVEHCKELFETIIGKGQTIREVKQVILDTAKEKEVDLGIGVDQMRLRRKQWRNPALVYLDDMVIARDIQIFLSMELFVEPLPGPEPMKSAKHIQLYLRRWKPSELAIGPFEEIIISSSKVSHIKQQISDISGIPAEKVEFAKGHGTFPHDISILDVERELNWNPDCDAINGHPLYITTDGFLLYYRDSEEKLKELTNEEMEEMKKKENKRLNKYYSSGYASSTSTRTYWGRKEKALKIYTDDETTTTTATTTTTTTVEDKSDDLGLD